MTHRDSHAPARRGRWLAALGAIALAAVILATLGAPEPEAAAPSAAPPVAPARADCDLACATERALPAASVACTRAIEQLAAFGARWTSGEAARARFQRFRWLDPSAGTITFTGNEAQFMNGSGGYAPVDYECDFDPKGGTVSDARARQRRLP